MLVLASAAFPEVGTPGLDPFRGIAQPARNHAPREAPFHLGQLYFSAFPGEQEGNEDDEVANPANAFTSEGEIRDLESDSVADGEWRTGPLGIPRAWVVR